MHVLATLIEIDPGCPPGYWYAHLAGRRLWARPANEWEERDCWVILPGQEAPAGSVILSEHAWTIREAEVDFRLVEGDTGQKDLGLAG
jgi:hypothetical protein